MNKITAGLVAGFVATVVLSAMMLAKTMMDATTPCSRHAISTFRRISRS